MYTAYKLNKWQYTALTYSIPNLEPVCCFISGSNCCFLTCVQISQEAGNVVWYFHLFQNFLQFVVFHTVRAFGIVNRCFSGTLLLSQWYNWCWQFVLWFLCLFSFQLEHLEFHSSWTVEAWLGEFWTLLCAGVQPQLIQGIRRRDGIGEGQETTA